MPFTLAHPAAILPVARALRGRVIVSALVIGSMVPDLPNLFPRLASREETHALYGLLWFALPVGLLAYAFFHLVLARPLAGLLPEPLRARTEPFLHDPARFESDSLARAAFSIFLGALTHLVWDSFTHPGAPMVNAFAILRVAWLRVGSEELAGHRVLQLVSTATGLGALALWGWRWKHASGTRDAVTSGSAADPVRAGTIGLLAGIALGFATHASLGGLVHGSSFSGVMRPLRDGAIAGMEGLLFAVIVFSAVWHALVLFERLRGARDQSADPSR